MKRFITILSAAAAVLTLSASAPAGYYKSLQGKSGKELKDSIQALIAPHTVHSYNSLWYYFFETDARLDDSSQVWDMYSNETYFWGTRGDAVSGMNKEHSFPKSWWGGSKVDAYTDLNHLMPSDSRANTAKSNWPLGEVSTTQSLSFNNGVTRVGAPKTGQGGGASKVFEPADEYKGDFARTYFYMATIYQDYRWVTTWQVDSVDAYGNTNWKTLTPWSIDLLVRWAREDSVSEKEIARNDAVFRCQNNRNPFIDDPLLFEYIWGNRAGQPYDSSHGGEVNPDPEPTDEPQLITPTQGTILDFGDVELGETATRTLYVKGLYLTSDLKVQLYRYDYRLFSVPGNTLDYTQVCTDHGYPLEVSYTPTEVGEHRAKLLLLGGGLVGSVGVEIRARCNQSELRLEGDLNGDYVVDVEDLNLMMNMMLGYEVILPLDDNVTADLTGDGVVDIEDVNALINIILTQH
ncbi:MAG: endonuclease [Muribaculaceae bacterium]|nr:endonuclease [Muribaculaceae bacterium]